MASTALGMHIYQGINFFIVQDVVLCTYFPPFTLDTLFAFGFSLSIHPWLQSMSPLLLDILGQLNADDYVLQMTMREPAMVNT